MIKLTICCCRNVTHHYHNHTRDPTYNLYSITIITINYWSISYSCNAEQFLVKPNWDGLMDLLIWMIILVNISLSRTLF